MLHNSNIPKSKSILCKRIKYIINDFIHNILTYLRKNVITRISIFAINIFSKLSISLRFIYSVKYMYIMAALTHKMQYY